MFGDTMLLLDKFKIDNFSETTREAIRKIIN